MQGSLGSNSRQKTGEVMEERGYMCGLYSLLSLLSHATQEPLLRLVLPTGGRAFLQQSLINQMPHKLACWPIRWGCFSQLKFSHLR